MLKNLFQSRNRAATQTQKFEESVRTLDSVLHSIIMSYFQDIIEKQVNLLSPVDTDKIQMY